MQQAKSAVESEVAEKVTAAERKAARLGTETKQGNADFAWVDESDSDESSADDLEDSD